MANYTLGQAYASPNIPERMWYAMTENDKASILASEEAQFADKCYIIATKKLYILGNDNTWYEM